MRQFFVYFIMILLGACSNSDNQEDNYEDAMEKCSSIQVRKVLENSIPARVEVIEDGDYFFNGNKKYLEVDAEKYLVSLADEFNLTTIKIFVSGVDLGEKGRDVKIKGTILNCATGAHGRHTNNLWDFYLLENPVIE
ncbi:hypothetical protein [Salegentibacter sp. Hel_I_6]|uniref:hypothetical protein n=1 Tax=Salegentibacter sp. Hel_I_6 TaxID=1250278 RepID=UPI000564C922|nr:hypothetical protein [Salegentibacter sp. Hel_I_6]